MVVVGCGACGYWTGSGRALAGAVSQSPITEPGPVPGFLRVARLSEAQAPTKPPPWGFCCAGPGDSRRGAAAAAAEIAAAPREKQNQDRSAINLRVNDKIQKNYQARILRVAYFVPCRFDRFWQSLGILPRFATTRPLSAVLLSIATRPSCGRSARHAGAVPPGQAAQGRGQREGWPH